MSSSRVFLDTDVPATQEYLAWLGTQDTKLATIDDSQVTKVETVTIGELQDFLRTQSAQKATFNCVATIDQLKLDNGWYYIGCGDCNTKLTKSASTLVCHKCENENAIGVINA